VGVLVGAALLAAMGLWADERRQETYRRTEYRDWSG
jgi:hypothetical protein